MEYYGAYYAPDIVSAYMLMALMMLLAFLIILLVSMCILMCLILPFIEKCQKMY